MLHIASVSGSLRLRLEARGFQEVRNIDYQFSFCSLWAAERCPFSVKKHVLHKEFRAESLRIPPSLRNFSLILFIAMTLSKLDVPMACSNPFVDRTTSLWIAEELVTSTSDKDDFKRRRPKCHATQDNAVKYPKPRMTESLTKERSGSCLTLVEVRTSEY